MLTISEFCGRHRACHEGLEWAVQNCQTLDEVWRKAQPEWLIWVATRPGVLDDRTLRLFACWSVRQVWHLLTDERSRRAVEVAERYADGQATAVELRAASAAAWNTAWNAASAAASAAAWAASAAASAAAWAASAAARAAALDAAWNTALDAQAEWLRANATPCFAARQNANQVG